MQLTEVHYIDSYGVEFEKFRKKYLPISKSAEGLDYYVQFTDFDSDILYKSGFKFPNHADPVGVYAYPLKYVINYPQDIKYGRERKFLRIIKSNAKNIIWLQTLSKNEIIHILYKMGIDQNFLIQSSEKIDFSDFNSNFEKSYQSMDSMLNFLVKNYKYTGKNKFTKAFMSAFQLDLSQPYAILSGKIKFRTRSGLEQTKLLQKAGIDALRDSASTNKSAIINSAEPEQIVFLTRKFSIVDIFNLHNKKTQYTDYKNIPIKLANEIFSKLNDKIIKIEQDYNNFEYYSIFAYSKNNKKIQIKIVETVRLKKFKNNKLYDDHYIIIELYGEKNNLELTYPNNVKISDIVKDPRILNFDFKNIDYKDDIMSKIYSNRNGDFLKIVNDIAKLANHKLLVITDSIPITTFNIIVQELSRSIHNLLLTEQIITEKLKKVLEQNNNRFIGHTKKELLIISKFIISLFPKVWKTNGKTFEEQSIETLNSLKNLKESIIQFEPKNVKLAKQDLDNFNKTNIVPEHIKKKIDIDYYHNILKPYPDYDEKYKPILKKLFGEFISTNISKGFELQKEYELEATNLSKEIRNLYFSISKKYRNPTLFSILDKYQKDEFGELDKNITNILSELVSFLHWKKYNRYNVSENEWNFVKQWMDHHIENILTDLSAIEEKVLNFFSKVENSQIPAKQYVYEKLNNYYEIKNDFSTLQNYKSYD